jgi:adenylate cyclase class 2
MPNFSAITAATFRNDAAMAHAGQEIEIKLAVESASAARRLLRRAGFRVAHRRAFEANMVYDTPDGTLRSTNQLLRVRESGGAVILTYKGPPKPGPHKSREEVETEVCNGRAIESMLERLGFQPKFRYEKYRAEYRRPGASGVATVDEMPIGTFVELEGTARWIDRTARQLGFGRENYITASYGWLYFEWCRRAGVKPSNMVFPGRPSARRAR